MKKGFILLLFITIAILGCDIDEALPDVIEYGVLRIESPQLAQYTLSWVDIDIVGNGEAISLSLSNGKFKEYTLPTGSYTIIGVWRISPSGVKGYTRPIDDTIYLSTIRLIWTP